MCRYSLTYFFYIYIFQCKALAQIWNHRFCHVSLLFSTGVKHTHLTASWTCSYISTLLPNSYPLSSGPQTSPAFPLNPVFALLLPCSSCRLGHRSLQLPSSCHTTPHHSPYTHYFQCFFFLFFLPNCTPQFHHDAKDSEAHKKVFVVYLDANLCFNAVKMINLNAKLQLCAVSVLLDCLLTNTVLHSNYGHPLYKLPILHCFVAQGPNYRLIFFELQPCDDHTTV